MANLLQVVCQMGPPRQQMTDLVGRISPGGRFLSARGRKPLSCRLTLFLDTLVDSWILCYPQS